MKKQKLTISEWMKLKRWNMYSLAEEFNARGKEKTPEIQIHAHSVQNWRNGKHAPYPKQKPLLIEIANGEDVSLVFE